MSFPLTQLAEDPKTVTLGWDPQPGADGFRFYADGVPVSRTFDPARRTVRFAKGAAEYRVEVLKVTAGDTGTYPPTTTPPPPPAGNVVEITGTVTADQLEQRIAAAPVGPITVRPAGSSFTVTGEFTLTRPDITIQHAVIDELLVQAAADRVTVEDSTLRFFYLLPGGVDRFTMQRCTVDGQFRTNQNWMYDATNFRFLDNTFRRYSDQSDPDNHSEAIFVAARNRGGLIDGNLFDDNGRTGHLFFSWWGGDANNQQDYPRDICVRNNQFRRSHNSYYHIQFRPEIPYSSWPIFIAPSNTFDNSAGPGPMPLRNCPQ